jgi:hypothetical protein
VAIAGIAMGVLVVIGVLITLFSRRKSSPSSNFLDEEMISQRRSFTPLASQELSQDLRADITKGFKGFFFFFFPWEIHYSRHQK